MGMLGEACLPSNAYYPRTPDYTLYSGVHVCWSEPSDLSFVYGFMSLDYGFGTMITTTYLDIKKVFDTVWLLLKLRACGFEVETVSRTEDFLKGRRQKVTVKGEDSDFFITYIKA